MLRPSLMVMTGLLLCGPLACKQAAALDRSARLTIKVTRTQGAGYLDGIPPDTLTALETAGYVFRDTEFDYPETEAIGRYLKVGDTFVSVGMNGEFFIPASMTVKDPVAIYESPTDPESIGTVNILPALSPSTQPLQTIVLSLQAGPLGSAAVMDGTTDAGMASAKPMDHAMMHHPSQKLADGCSRVDCDTSSNERGVGCCADFAETKGRINENGKDSTGTLCSVKRFWEYLGTTCDAYVRRNVCLIESATGLGRVGCYDKHKYRFCQLMDENDFSVTPTGSASVIVGGTLSFTIENNTPGNETMISLVGDPGGALGKLSAPAGLDAAGSGQSLMRHYEDSEQKHYRERVLVYTAPIALAQGETEAFDHLTLTSWGRTEEVTIRITQSCKAANGTTSTLCANLDAGTQ